MEWIKVEDGLPDHLDKVLVAFEFSSNILMASYQIKLGGRSGEFFPYFADGRKSTERVITHWMPLPEPPKP